MMISCVYKVKCTNWYSYFFPYKNRDLCFFPLDQECVLWKRGGAYTQYYFTDRVNNLDYKSNTDMYFAENPHFWLPLMLAWIIHQAVSLRHTCLSLHAGSLLDFRWIISLILVLMIWGFYAVRGAFTRNNSNPPASDLAQGATAGAKRFISLKNNVKTFSLHLTFNTLFFFLQPSVAG